MKKHVIFHGHFYQPPRENPWTGLIPGQPSAAPFHDWNERIFSECYRANSASRYLNPEGRIIKINNNYEKMSFNFGPTLLNWIAEFHPEVYRRIQQADRTSMEHFNGHGNAIAQVYNHVIMPLADEKDKRTQIEWGIADFKKHFDRMPEGMWLAETAVDYKTIDLLIEYGIKYIILSPWQAQSVRPIEGTKWSQITNPQDVAGRAYTVKGETGELAAFFYDHIFAQGVSFEHYLRDADQLYGRLLEKAAMTDQPLIHCATDGEVYGHHEPFGDMCYSALIEKIAQGRSLILDNYGNFLEQHPPQFEAKIKLGEKNLGSSWSCFHGVSRWYKDCGCNTGSQEGWNQKWRKPLRESFDHLNHKLRTLFTRTMEELSAESPEIIWNSYIDVLTGKTSRETFASLLLKKNSRENFTRFFRILESRRFAMYMYTSCGWFFSELSGIEPVQNICYALKAIELVDSEKDLMHDFLKHLSKAHSNIKSKGNGRDIAREAARWYRRDPEHIAAGIIAEAIAGASPDMTTTPIIKSDRGDYLYRSISFASKENYCTGKVSFSNRLLGIQYDFDFHVDVNDEGKAAFEFKSDGEKRILPAQEAGIDPAIRHNMILRLLADWNSSDSRFNRLLILLEEMADDDSGLTEEASSFYFSLINLRIGKILKEIEISRDYLKQQLNFLPALFEAVMRGGDHTTESVRLQLSSIIHREVLNLHPGKSFKADGEQLIALCKTIYHAGIKCDLTDAQGAAFDLLTQSEAEQKAADETLFNKTEHKLLIKVCDYLNIDTGAVIYG